MRNLLAFTLFFLYTATILAQGSETQILGNWKFNDFANKEKIPTAQIDMMKDMFKDIVFQFDNTKKYQFGGMSKTEKGNWVIEDKSTLKLTSEKGIVTKIKIVKIDEQFLVIDMDGPVLKLQKGKIIETIKTETKPSLTFVAATIALLSKKWFLVKVEKPNRTAAQIEQLAQIMKGTFFEFKSNSKAIVKVLKIEETFNWAFENQNKTIHLKNDDGEKIWNVVKIDAENLELVQGNMTEKWVFSTKE